MDAIQSAVALRGPSALNSLAVYNLLVVERIRQDLSIDEARDGDLEDVLAGRVRLRSAPRGVVVPALLDVLVIGVEYPWLQYSAVPANHRRGGRIEGSVVAGEAEGAGCLQWLFKRVETRRAYGGRDHVEGSVVPQVKNVPGIVSATFTTDDGGRTLNLFLFETEQAALTAAEGVRVATRPPFIRLETVELREVRAHF